MLEDFAHRKASNEGRIGDHFNNLYDENEDRAGQKVDEATGRPINNSPVVDGNDEKLSPIKRAPGAASHDILGTVPEKEDAAAKWLRENDPHWRDSKEAA